MRKLMVSFLAAGLLAGSFALPAAAHHRPSSDGAFDHWVAGTQKTDAGVRKFFVLSTVQMKSFELCVWHVNKPRRCKNFSMKGSEAGWERTLRWRRHFPYQGTGKYNFVFRQGGTRWTKVLGFHE